MIKKIAVLTSRGNWFVPYARSFVASLNRSRSGLARLFYDHKKISQSYEVVFILSYGRLIERAYLPPHRRHLVVHASDLPQGTGWAPLFWQILEGKNEIPFVLFEAAEGADTGPIYLKSLLRLRGDELHDELRHLEAMKVLELCRTFLERYPRLKPRPQKGRRTFYRRRTPRDSELQLDRTLRDQVPLLRTVSNRDFPAFFYYRGRKYLLQITREDPDAPTRK